MAGEVWYPLGRSEEMSEGEYQEQMGLIDDPFPDGESDSRNRNTIRRRANQQRRSRRPSRRGWWHPRIGDPVRIRDMTDAHLLNSARYIARYAEQLIYLEIMSISRYIASAPDGAADAASYEADQMCEMEPDEAIAHFAKNHPLAAKYRELKKEIERRGLTEISAYEPPAPQWSKKQMADRRRRLELLGL